MAITAARWASRDNFRLEYQEDGGPEWVHIKGLDHPQRAVVLAAIPSPDAYVPTRKPGIERMDDITAEFWRRVAAHYGVSIDRARTHVGVMGAPAAVQALWQKATTLMDAPAVNIDDIKDDGSWT